MSTSRLFFATNRRHKGGDQWHPKGYGPDFSTSGMQNLRFGELDIDVDDHEVEGYLSNEVSGRKGDGEGLSGYLAKLAKKADIAAYEDLTPQVDEPIPPERNSSTKMFRSLKKEMEKSADVLIYIHGYNVSWRDAVGAALALQYMLNRRSSVEHQKNGVLVVLFSWPSDGSMIPFAAYRSDREDAQASGPAVGRALLKLRDFLIKLRKGAKNKEECLCEQDIHLLCHSMGNFVLQNALQKMEQNPDGPSLQRLFQHVFLCAPDVDDNVLEPDQPMERLHETCRHIAVYHNKGDVAMLLSDYTKAQPDRLGHAGNAHPYLVHNKVHQVDCSRIVAGAIEHSYYLWATVSEDIRFSIEGKDFEDPSRRREPKGNYPNVWVMK